MIPQPFTGIAVAVVGTAAILIFRKPLRAQTGEAEFAMFTFWAFCLNVVGGGATALCFVTENAEFAWIPFSVAWTFLAAWLAGYFISEDAL